MKRFIVGLALAAIFGASSLLVTAQQAEQIKKKARDLKRDVESTNSVAKTNAPPRTR
jgi:cell division protein FtsB